MLVLAHPSYLSGCRWPVCSQGLTHVGDARTLEHVSNTNPEEHPPDEGKHIMTGQPYTPTPYVGIGAIVEYQSTRYIVLKPNPKNLLVERESDGKQFNLPRTAPYTVVGQKPIGEMFSTENQYQPYNIVTYTGPKFPNKLMVVVKVDVLTKTMSLADLDDPSRRLGRVPFDNVKATKVVAVAE